MVIPILWFYAAPVDTYGSAALSTKMNQGNAILRWIDNPGYLASEAHQLSFIDEALEDALLRAVAVALADARYPAQPARARDVIADQDQSTHDALHYPVGRYRFSKDIAIPSGIGFTPSAQGVVADAIASFVDDLGYAPAQLTQANSGNPAGKHAVLEPFAIGSQQPLDPIAYAVVGNVIAHQPKLWLHLFSESGKPGIPSFCR